jgi:hypothetical protein
VPTAQELQGCSIALIFQGIPPSKPTGTQLTAKDMPVATATNRLLRLEMRSCQAAKKLFRRFEKQRRTEQERQFKCLSCLQAAVGRQGNSCSLLGAKKPSISSDKTLTVVLRFYPLYQGAGQEPKIP